MEQPEFNGKRFTSIKNVIVSTHIGVESINDITIKLQDLYLLILKLYVFEQTLSLI